jgi:hypothetical protein
MPDDPLVLRDRESLIKHDDLRRRVPARISGYGWVQLFVSLGLTYRVVPDEFWNLDTNDDGISIARVACPCGHEPEVEVAAYPIKCKCPRWFFFGGTEVLAFCTPES